MRNFVSMWPTLNSVHTMKNEDVSAHLCVIIRVHFSIRHMQEQYIDIRKISKKFSLQLRLGYCYVSVFLQMN
jgi:hypothetical protein